MQMRRPYCDAEMTVIGFLPNRALEHVCFKLKHQGSKRCPALLRRARAGSVRSTGIAVNEKTWSVSVKDGHALDQDILATLAGLESFVAPARKSEPF